MRTLKEKAESLFRDLDILGSFICDACITETGCGCFNIVKSTDNKNKYYLLSEDKDEPVAINCAQDLFEYLKENPCYCY
jgi:hypothetical protein